MKKCIACGEEIHPKRLEILPNAIKCVACSTTSRKAGVNVMKGEGDHTYVETIIMERDEFLKYQEAELRARGKRPDEIPHPEETLETASDTDDDENINWGDALPEDSGDEEIFSEDTED